MHIPGPCPLNQGLRDPRHLLGTSAQEFFMQPQSFSVANALQGGPEPCDLSGRDLACVLEIPGLWEGAGPAGSGLSSTCSQS